jgi:hypothetical protein
MDWNFIRLDNEDQIRAHKLDAFAASFDHQVERLYPIWLAYLEDRLVCYCHLHKQMVAYPAIHPSISPREFHDLANTWFRRIKIDYGDPLVCVPESFPWGNLSKVGLERCNVFKIRD